MKINLRFYCFVFSAFTYGGLYAQAPVKKLKAIRTNQAIKIDGLLEEEAWNQAELATDFIQLRPNPGTPEKQRTEVKILYDDLAIYVYARMNEVSADSIAKQIVPRDQVGNADFIGIIFDTYLDKINGSGFYVTAAGSQYDAKYSQTGNEDDNWNAVWFSSVKIDAKGWSAEMKIPFSALRFSSKDIQNWGLNITRRRQKFNQQSFWNKVDPNIDGFINQGGELTNIENIKAPVRLSFSPYISNNTNYYPSQATAKDLSSKLNGGMDVKYGITNAFTLDMTLVPDFGQVLSDNKILNLTPFEVRFNENRQFFTEGTEMFNKGDLFYSRRVGIDPVFGYLKGGVGAKEVIASKPQGSKLINASKVSGRTANGLGIGVFNALTNTMYATIKDTSKATERLTESQPLTNYSIVVFDQSLRNNSSVTFLNTNVLREGPSYDANVSAFLFRLNNKKNNYFVKGDGKLSYLTPKADSLNAERGINYSFGFGKQSGKFRWRYDQELSDKKYYSGDLGFFTNNNYYNHQINLSYNIYKPTKWFNQLESWVGFAYSERLTKRQYQSSGIYPGVWVQFKNFWTMNINSNWNLKENDFYEARVEGKIFSTPGNFRINANINTNRSKRYRMGVFADFRQEKQFSGWGYGLGSWQNYNVNDKLTLGTEFTSEPRFNYVGWVDKFTIANTNNSQTIFSTYNRKTIEAVFTTKYTFTPRMGISLRARHYWSERENKKFYSLNNNGSLLPTVYSKNKDQNYNVFNVDMIYTWQVAPGSELSIAYKDSASNSGNILQDNYKSNLSSTLRSP